MCMFEVTVFAKNSRPELLPVKPDTTLGDLTYYLVLWVMVLPLMVLLLLGECILCLYCIMWGKHFLLFEEDKCYYKI